MTPGGAALAPLVELRGIAKSYDGVHALRGVDLRVAPGEVHALLGENGAGKSTLIKILAGAVSRDAGEIRWQGEPVEISSRRDALAIGIGTIFQHPELVDHLTVAENVTLGTERSVLGFFNRAESLLRTRRQLDRLGTSIDPGRRAGSLRPGERQLVEIAQALADDVRLLIMDEPTASLGVAEVERLLAVVRQLRDSGIAVLYISHRLEEILTLSDRITVLRDGSEVGSIPTAEATRARVVSMMVGRLAATEVTPPRQRRPDCVLRVADVTAPGVTGVSFDLHRGEILGLYGLMGSGRSELLHALFGASPLSSGRIDLDDTALDARSPADAVAAGVGLVPEDRAVQGTMLRLPVVDNLVVVHASRLARRGWTRPAAERRSAARVVEALGIKTASLAAPVATLSGGNQQKVVIGKWLSDETKVLLLDEPTAGVDVGAKAEIYRIIADLVTNGTAVVLATSELPELMGLADRVLVLRDGQVAGIVEGDDLEEATILRLAFGEEPTPEVMAGP